MKFFSRSKPLWLYKCFLLLAAAVWGLGTVVLKSTVYEISPLWLVSARFLGSGLLLLLFVWPRIRGKLDKEHLFAGSVLGLWLFLSYWANTTGITDTTACNSSFLTALYCVIIPFLGWALGGKKPKSFNVVAAFVCTAGIGFVSFSGVTSFSLRFGDAITLLSAVFLSFHVIYTAKYAPRCDMTLLTVLQFFVAGIISTFIGLVSSPIPNITSFTFETWISLAYLIAPATCLALLLQNVAVARVPPAPASLFLATESVFGVVFSLLLLGEVLTPALICGFALIFLGIVISEYLPLRAAQKSAQEKTLPRNLQER